MNTTLFELLGTHQIEIPLIQRDFAQGRADKAVEYIRNNIVAAIGGALRSGSPLDLDFVYGKDEVTIPANRRLIPIDGQQRLTTLFLLHWYMAVRDGELAGAQDLLKRFSYKTRVSSSDFCAKLIANQITLPTLDQGQPTVSDVLEDQPWFIASWIKDPTVAGMLTMLNTLHRYLFENPGTFRRLVDDRLVTFHIADMRHLDLDDNTYIRMNARGKLLTEYEHLKAQLEKFLEDRNPALRKSLALKMDKQWSRTLWAYRDDKHLIDSAFMALFGFASEMSYYLDARLSGDGTFTEFQEKKGPNYWHEIYSADEAVDRLIAYMDILTVWGVPQEFFAGISNPPEYGRDDIKLIEGMSDLVARCIHNEQYAIPEKVLLFFVLEYCRTFPQFDSAIDLSERARVLRNLLNSVRQYDSYNFVYNTNLRYADMPKYLREAQRLASLDQPVYDALLDGYEMDAFPAAAVRFERYKAEVVASGNLDKVLLFRVEDNEVFRGLVQILTDADSLVRLAERYETFLTILAVPDQGLVLRALLTQRNDSGEYYYFGVWHEYSAIGERWYFGHGDRWRGLLTSPKAEEDGTAPALRKILDTVRDKESAGMGAEQALREILDEWLAEHTLFDDWRYYFVKYAQILDSRSNLFAWKRDDNDFEVRNMSSFHARGRHVNIYARAVERLINNSEIVMHDRTRTWGNGISPLVLKHDIELWCEKDGWRIRDPNRKARKLVGSLISDHPDHRGQFLLVHTDVQDRIEVALEFIHTLFPQMAIDE